MTVTIIALVVAPINIWLWVIAFRSRRLSDAPSHPPTSVYTVVPLPWVYDHDRRPRLPPLGCSRTERSENRRWNDGQYTAYVAMDGDTTLGYVLRRSDDWFVARAAGSPAILAMANTAANAARMAFDS